MAGETSSSIEEQAERDRIEGAFLEMSHQIKTTSSTADVARTMDLAPEHGRAVVDPDAGWITVELVDDGTACTLLDERPLGSVRYEQGDSSVAFQGGGVWSASANESAMLSSPAVYYSPGSTPEEATLHLPVTSVTGEGTVTGTIDIESLETTRVYPASGTCLSGSHQTALRNGDVEITIHSEYYLAWGRFFEAEVDGEVSYGPDGSDEVSVSLASPLEGGGLEGPIVSDAVTLELTNYGEIDSYDSTGGPYAPPGNANAPVVVEGNFTPSVDVVVGGSVKAGGDAHVANAIDVSGDVTIAGASEVSNDPWFGGTYATGETLSVQGGTFGDDVLAGDHVEAFQSATVHGDLHAGGDAAIGTGTEIFGDVIADGDVVVTGGATVHGEIHASGDVTFEHQATHHNDVYAGGSVTLEPVDAQVVGTVRAGEDVRLEWASEIDGDVYAGGDITSNGGSVTGAATAGGSVDDDSVDGSSTDSASPPPSPAYRLPDDPPAPEIDTPDAVDEEIEAAGDRLADENDNTNTTRIVGGELVGCEAFSGCTLEAGSYYLDEIALDGTGSNAETLVLDTSDGPITLYVDSDLSVVEEANVEVVGDGGVTVYLNGEFLLTNEGTIDVAGQRAPLLWVHMNADSSAQLSVDSSFVGVLHGPGGSGASGTDVDISGRTTIYGAVVGNVESTANDNRIHFDEALTEPPQSETATTTAQVSYLDVVLSEVHLSSGP
ncbi:hypothetical protein GCM10025298_25080 [Natronobiforma cellulositropha]